MCPSCVDPHSMECRSSLPDINIRPHVIWYKFIPAKQWSQQCTCPHMYTRWLPRGFKSPPDKQSWPFPWNVISATGFLIDEKIFAYRSFHITPLYFYKRSYAVLVVHSELHTVFYMRISFLLNLRSFYDVDSNRISKIDLYDKYRFFQKICRQIRRFML